MWEHQVFISADSFFLVMLEGGTTSKSSYFHECTCSGGLFGGLDMDEAD